MDVIEAIKQIVPANGDMAKKAFEKQKNMIKPMGSLGVLEEIAIKFSSITEKLDSNINKKILFLFGADNGVYEEGISGSPQNLTRDLLISYSKNKNHAINIICDFHKTDLKLVDMGVIGNINDKNIDDRKLMNGTNNLMKMPAMTKETAIKAMNIGFEYAKYAKEKEYDIIGNGEVGMGNTTTSTICILASLGIKECINNIGRGGGLSDEAFEKKKSIIKDVLEKYNFDKNEPIDIIAKAGGLDIAAMTGLYIGAAYYKIPIVIDGLISVSAALISYRLNPIIKDYMFASHISKEPAYAIAIKEIGLKPMLNLEMRLGEGSGCPLAFSIIETSLYIMNNMASFADVSIDHEYRKNIKTD